MTTPSLPPRVRPIPFKGEMVRAIVAGTKSQTRRIVKLPHQNPLGKWEPTTYGGPNGGRTKRGETIPEHAAIWHTRTGDCIGAPWVVGDRLWVREAWRTVREADALPPRDLDAAYRFWYEADAPHQPGFGNLRPGMFMPRFASRITLEITGVRVERLKDISEADALAEGIGRYDNGTFGLDDPAACMGSSAVVAYMRLWSHINGPGSWDANPWVWVVEFVRAAEYTTMTDPLRQAAEQAVSDTPLPKAAMREAYQGAVRDWFATNQMRGYGHDCALAALAAQAQEPAAGFKVEAVLRELVAAKAARIKAQQAYGRERRKGWNDPMASASTHGLVSAPDPAVDAAVKRECDAWDAAESALAAHPAAPEGT